MDSFLKAGIITIGDELLIGQVIDTNSAWMAQVLNRIGLSVARRVAVGDQWDAIWQALDEESRHAQIILITGGLGPTADDITKPLLASYFESGMRTDERVRDHVTHIFRNRHQREPGERNLKQAEVPEKCTVLFNRVGTAPGMWFEKNGVIFISMPGVPHEMKTIMEEEVIPSLKARFQFPTIEHRTLVTSGIGESALADHIADWEERLPADIKLAYLPGYGLVRLRLSVITNQAAVIQQLDDYFLALQKLVAAYLVTNRDESMESMIGHLLASRKETVCTAESCTGGYIAHLITSVPGSSAYFEGSIVSYSYLAKENLLGVDPIMLIEEGAVSQAVVKKMAEEARKKFGTTYALAVSGIMGPDGGTPDKPVGTVWMAVSGPGDTIARVFRFGHNRERNTELTARQALNLLRIYIRELDTRA